MKSQQYFACILMFFVGALVPPALADDVTCPLLSSYSTGEKSDAPELYAGLLVKFTTGQQRLFLGPLVGGGHHRLAVIADYEEEIEAILWGGELSLSRQEGDVELLAANKTSSYVYQNMSRPSEEGYSFSNDGSSLLKHVKGLGWKTLLKEADVTYSEDKKHLDPALNELDENIRHAALNVLNVTYVRLQVLSGMIPSSMEPSEPSIEIQKKWQDFLLIVRTFAKANARHMRPQERKLVDVILSIDLEEFKKIETHKITALKAKQYYSSLEGFLRLLRLGTRKGFFTADKL